MPREADAADDDCTTRSSSGSTESSGELLAGSTVWTFVIAWCRKELERIGELAIVPSAGADLVLGRGAPDNEPRMRFYRPEPGRLEPAAPLASPSLSRRQALIRPGAERIGVRRVGRCPMKINGVTCEEGSLSSGDTLAFRQELVLLCLRRPACPAPLRHYRIADRAGFGRVDALGLLGESPAMWLLRDELAFAAKSERHVLLVGESGTGKELAARAIHGLSSRADRPLVARNAATLPATLIDAEMFGNLKNYPNPGMSDRPGLVGQANGGFLFLDEIADLSSELQAHLLRVLDSGGEYQRLGESTSRQSDFRLLAATSRDPADLRPDLLARLTIKVEVPPLAERREDISLLVQHLARRAASGSPKLVQPFLEIGSDGLEYARIDAKLIDALVRRDYRGNIRELDEMLWKAMSASGGDFITFHDSALPAESWSGAEGVADTARPSPRTRNREPSEAEVREALARAGGNVQRAAKELGLSSRYALYRRLVKLGIEPDG
jgi:DNA-binding NtrC family response regulator